LSAEPTTQRASRRAAWALVFNAFVWGTSWWPLRRLQEAGLHPLWATAIIFTLASLAIAIARPRACLQVARTPALWLLVLAAGLTNASFNWAIVIGDVVRVVLLFYLMPLWTVLLARVVLGERLTNAAALRVALGVIGATIVLWPSSASERGSGSAMSPAAATGDASGQSTISAPSVPSAIRAVATRVSRSPRTTRASSTVQSGIR